MLAPFRTVARLLKLRKELSCVNALTCGLLTRSLVALIRHHVSFFLRRRSEEQVYRTTQLTLHYLDARMQYVLKNCPLPYLRESTDGIAERLYASSYVDNAGTELFICAAQNKICFVELHGPRISRKRVYKLPGLKVHCGDTGDILSLCQSILGAETSVNTAEIYRRALVSTADQVRFKSAECTCMLHPETNSPLLLIQFTHSCTSRRAVNREIAATTQTVT